MKSANEIKKEIFDRCASLAKNNSIAGDLDRFLSEIEKNIIEARELCKMSTQYALKVPNGKLLYLNGTELFFRAYTRAIKQSLSDLGYNVSIVQKDLEKETVIIKISWFDDSDMV